MRGLTLLVCLFLLSPNLAAAQFEPRAAAEHLDTPLPEIATADEATPALDLETRTVEAETSEVEDDRSEAQASDRLTQFLYSVAVGVAVAVLSTLILRAIV